MLKGAAGILQNCTAPLKIMLKLFFLTLIFKELSLIKCNLPYTDIGHSLINELTLGHLIVIRNSNGDVPGNPTFQYYKNISQRYIYISFLTRQFLNEQMKYWMDDYNKTLEENGKSYIGRKNREYSPRTVILIKENFEEVFSDLFIVST